MIPEIKWLQKYDKVRISISMCQVSEINENECDISLTDNVFKFKYGEYSFEQRFNHEANWNLTVKYKPMYIQVIILKQQQMEEWDFLFQDRKFNKSHVKVDWSDWTFEEERVNDMFVNHAGDENIKKMMEQYQLGDENEEDTTVDPNVTDDPDITDDTNAENTTSSQAINTSQ